MMRSATEQTYKERILRVLVHIQEHLDDALPLETLARVACFSPHHFHRIFGAMVGESVKEHIRRLIYIGCRKSLSWGGWAPRLTANDLLDWPPDVKTHLIPNYPIVEQEIGITAARRDSQSAPLLARFQAAIAGSGMTAEPAPLAVQSTAPVGVLFGFDKYSSANLLIEALREDARRDPCVYRKSVLSATSLN